jgi:hypothetical protein
MICRVQIRRGNAACIISLSMLFIMLLAAAAGCDEKEPADSANHLRLIGRWLVSGASYDRIHP